ncbi:hypothetical protein O181_060065 [Austropuccinia psidii MF-1]|uniref:Uncharacterized protein n=1 Tax=Austropuccinia psidii MF-1 TaxID=1389203 RepID=A0A9Q3ECP2_9BASI|nr:hypothetical protein [Austropuccinia psidii MF-1]
MNHGNRKRTFELGPIITMYCQPWDSKAKVKQNQLNPPQQDSAVPGWPREKTTWQPTPGPSAFKWSEDLFHCKQLKFPLISTFDSSKLTLPPFVEPFQPNEPPIPGLSPSSKPHKDVLTREAEPEVAPMQSMEEPFGKSPLYLFYLSQLFLTLPQPSPACPAPPPP